MGTFRPSARVRLQIRAEEFDDTTGLVRRLEAPTPAGAQRVGGAPPQAGGGNVDAQLVENQRALSELIARRNATPAPQFTAERSRLERERDRLQRQQAQGGRVDTRQEPPETVSGAPADDRVILGNILPRSTTIERNGIRTADTCSIEIDRSDAPLDPRVIRACAVEVSLGSVAPGLWAQGVERGLRARDGMLLSVVERGTDAGILSPVTRFLGWVDEWDADADGSDGDSVSLTCRDWTSLLIDTPLPTGFAISLSDPIVTGIQALLDSIPATRGIRVHFGTEGGDDLGPVPGEALQSSRRARRGTVSRRARSGGQQMNVWDHITDTVIQLGLVPLMRGFDLNVIEPRTFYSGESAVRRMVYGRNLESLSFSRKLGGVRVPTVQVRCYDAQIGRTRWGQHPVGPGQEAAGVFGQGDPPRPHRANRPGVSGSNPDDRIQTFTVQGINDPTRLRQIAESTWQQIGRQEIEGKFKTDDISSVGTEVEGDLLDMDAGDAVELLVLAPQGQGAQDSTATTLQEIQAMTTGRRADYLEGLGWNRQTAERLAALQEATGFQTVFRVQNVRIEFDRDEGVQIRADWINFVTVRELRDTDQQAEPEAPSPEVETQTQGRTDQTAANAREASAERRRLLREREAGTLTDAEYTEQSESARSRELDAIAADLDN